MRPKRLAREDRPDSRLSFIVALSILLHNKSANEDDMHRISQRWRFLLSYKRLLGFRSIIAVARAKLQKGTLYFEVSEPGIRFPIYLRLPSSDIDVYKQVLRDREYAFSVNRDPAFVVDAGANIGLTSVYLANQFPNARILAIEPEKSNFEVLLKNVAPYPNIIPFQGALWAESAELNVVNPGKGNWGFRIDPQDGNHSNQQSTNQKIQSITVDAILHHYGLDQISIFKIDIEGAELEVFRNSASWIDKVDSCIIELHEHIRPGCNRSFHVATSGFDHEWSQGELVYRTRAEGCLKPPQQTEGSSSRAADDRTIERANSSQFS